LIRVLVANNPRLIRELLMATMFDQPDIEIVDEIEQESEIEESVERTLPDFLIVALDKANHLPTICMPVMRKHPNLRVIAVSPDGNNFVFYWASLRIHSDSIEASEAGVLRVLRTKVPPSEALQ
jgi:chemotaxis response regulator CheB